MHKWSSTRPHALSAHLILNSRKWKQVEHHSFNKIPQASDGSGKIFKMVYQVLKSQVPLVRYILFMLLIFLLRIRRLLLIMILLSELNWFSQNIQRGSTKEQIIRIVDLI
ncbi:uncharacterized protein LOC124692439 [Lolium rigidum]|uniref:uncharacterized protein LOC124692439 n=1 Tax=Lolium rigidum TaxID=89674 RepID=UPI001F5DD55D|nr:uncharacterized protein LOC124692439 [Lolium rigidum]